MKSGLSYRVVVAGTELRMLVLATEPSGSVGVDLDSRAFVRAAHPPGEAGAATFDVVTGEIAGSVDPPDAARPEAVELGAPPRRVGRLSARRAERYLAPLRHPPQLPLLGLGAPAVPYWTLSGDRPSLALVDLRSAPVLALGPDGLECRFTWLGVDHQLPVTDSSLVAGAEASGIARPSPNLTERMLGFRARRLLVVLDQPVEGYCHKTVAALLPGGR